jgi:hypothetical protein
MHVPEFRGSLGKRGYKPSIKRSVEALHQYREKTPIQVWKTSTNTERSTKK